MKAVVVHDFKRGPQFEADYPVPVPQADDVLVTVQGSALSHRARSSATGQHYTATGQLPMVPGVDGVGTLPNGKLVYFVADGSFAEQVAVAKGHWVELPRGIDAFKIAGLMNPALSSWMALKYRAHFKRGQKVMILGATGNAGRVAVQVAKRLGAAEIIGVARDADQLAALKPLGLTRGVELAREKATVQRELAEAGQDVDIILDYLWGDVAADAMWAIIPHRQQDQQPLTWVTIGTAAGQTAPIPSAAFRAVKLQLIGSGQGSVGVPDILTSFKEILKSEQATPFQFDVQVMPLADFATGWQATGGSRIVFTASR